MSTHVGIHLDEEDVFPVQLVSADQSSKGSPFVAVKLDTFTTVYPTLAALDAVIAAFEDARAVLVDALALLEPADPTSDELAEAEADRDEMWVGGCVVEDVA